MADATTQTQKKGLTGFGWLLLGGTAAYLLSSKERREKALGTARGWFGKEKPADTSPAG